jgi:UDP-N-acetylmuramoyl-tripeptide--D-alanyl-D-alanine ligase
MRLLQPLVPALWAAAGARRRLARRAHTLVAITGSFGKTTTARAIRCALGLPVGLTAGPNAGHALARALLRQSFATPFSVFEVGVGRTGAIARTARAFRPSVTVVTSIGSGHPLLESIQVTREEKFELVRHQAAGGTAILNGDDHEVRWMIGRAPGRTLTFGFDEGNDVRVESTSVEWPHGMRVNIRVGAWTGSRLVPLFGDHMAYAIAAALATAHVAGIDLDMAFDRLTTLPPTPGRMQAVLLPEGAYLLRDEYKSAIETVNRALDFLAKVPAVRRIVVLGEVTEPPPPRDEHLAAVAARVAGIAERVIVFGPTTDVYVTGLARAGMPPDRVVDAGDSWRRAFDALQGTLREGDVVLIKGRHSERLDRIALALQGRTVGCELTFCDSPLGRCDTCAMLEHGWGRIAPVL